MKKNKIINRYRFSLIVGMLSILMLAISCDNEDDATSEIDVIVPNDLSLKINTGFPGELIFVEGTGLRNIKRILFDDKVETVFNPTMNSDAAIIFTVPFSEKKGSRFGSQVISFFKEDGEMLTADFDLIQPEPEILGTTPVLPVPGETAIIRGTWLNGATEVLLEDIPLTFTQVDGEKITIDVPADLTEGGTLSVTTPAGTATKSIDVNAGTDVFLITDFDGGGLLPNVWQSFGEVASDGVLNDADSDGGFFELVWNDTGTDGFIVSQSDASPTPLIPAAILDGKTIGDVFLRMDINCGDAPGTMMSFVLVDGPGDCCDGNVNWQFNYTKETCGWETVEFNVDDFGHNYFPGNQDRNIDFSNILRVKIGVDINNGPVPQKFQFDNVKLIVK